MKRSSDNSNFNSNENEIKILEPVSDSESSSEVAVEAVEVQAPEDTVEVAVNKLFSKTFTSLPMIIRLKYLIDTLDKIPEDQVSFSRVNTMIHSNIADGDFNIIPDELNTKEDIVNLYNRICSGASGLSTWCKRVCKDCGNEFHMYLSEIDFYRNKGFALPKRCKSCVKARKESQQV